MAGTEFPLNHPLAVQVWSNSLAVESGKRQYFSKFMGTGESALIVVKTELQKQAGEKITVGLRMKLREDGVEGDNLIEGTSAEEDHLLQRFAVHRPEAQGHEVQGQDVRAARAVQPA